MKKLFMIIALGLVIQGCREIPDKLDPPGSKLEGINANWSLVEVEQVDIVSIQQATLDVSKAFLKNGTLQMDFNSSDFTYSVNASTPNYFGDQGSWFFDDNEFPTLIKLIPDGGDTITLNLLSTIRPIDAYLNFTMNRTCGPQNMPYIGYNFKFIRAN